MIKTNGEKERELEKSEPVKRLDDDDKVLLLINCEQTNDRS